MPSRPTSGEAAPLATSVYDAKACATGESPRPLRGSWPGLQPYAIERKNHETQSSDRRLDALAATFRVRSECLSNDPPIVESYDCQTEQARAAHPLGDVADPPGQTPGYERHSDTSSLQAIIVITHGFTDPRSPALFGHKLDGTCGRVGR